MVGQICWQAVHSHQNNNKFILFLQEMDILNRTCEQLETLASSRLAATPALHVRPVSSYILVLRSLAI